MFLKEVKSVLTAAMQGVFTASYPVEDFQNLFISIEYPSERQNYPALWCGFEPLGTIDRGGIDNYFGSPATQFLPSGTAMPISIWRATGYATYTMGALTSLQRDRLFDEIIRVLAFNQESDVTSFRALIEANPLIGMNMNFDNIAVRGISENAGTPWGTQDIMYEATLAIEAQIEFWSDNTATLIPVSEVIFQATNAVSGDVLQNQVPEP